MKSHCLILTICQDLFPEGNNAACVDPGNTNHDNMTGNPQ